MRADRLLSILLVLQGGRRIRARELADRLEVSERTILRDMEALSGCGIPVIADRGKGGGWSLLGDYQTKLTGLSATEIQSLFLARPARLMADLGLKREAEAALIKLEASLPAAAREQAERARRRIHIDSRGWRDPAESIAALPVLLDAIWRGKRVRFEYLYASGEANERVGDPLGLVAKGSTWYLIANVDAHRSGVEQAGQNGGATDGAIHQCGAGVVTRTYRVSRMREAATLDEPLVYPHDFDVAEYWSRSAADFREKLPRFYASFTAKPDVMKWVRYRGWRLEEEREEAGRVRIRIRFDVEEEAVQFALSFGGEVEVIEPESLREKVMAGARAILGM